MKYEVILLYNHILKPSNVLIAYSCFLGRVKEAHVCNKRPKTSQVNQIGQKEGIIWYKVKLLCKSPDCFPLVSNFDLISFLRGEYLSSGIVINTIKSKTSSWAHDGIVFPILLVVE